MAHLDDWGKQLNQWICYPDLLVDLMTPKDSEFTLYPFQRMMMREWRVLLNLTSVLVVELQNHSAAF